MEQEGYAVQNPISKKGLTQLNGALKSHLQFFSAPQDKQVVLIRVPLNEPWLQQFMLSENLPTQLDFMGTKLPFEQATFILKRSQKPIENSSQPTESIPWHQDTPHEMVSLWVPLEDVGGREGGLVFKKAAPADTPVYPIQIAPGNYGQTLDFEKMNTTRQEFEQDCVTLSLTAGQPVLFHGRTPHCSMLNQGDSWRPALVLRYIAEGAILEDGTSKMEEYGSIAGVEYCANPDGNLTRVSSVFHTGGGRGGHGRALAQQQQAVIAQQQQALQAQEQQIQAQKQQIQNLLIENAQLQGQVNQLLQNNQGNQALLAQLQARLAHIKALLAGLGVHI